MSRIVKVKSDKIPGVTHVDNTARIQTVNREQNEKFYDLINEFYKLLECLCYLTLALIVKSLL